MRGLATSTALALAATAFGLGTAGVRAQDVPIVTDRVDVRLVEVDAWAQDGGRPVLDLAAEELRLFEDGRKVEILFFTPPARAESASPSGERKTPATPPPVPNWRAGEEPRNNLVIFLDDAHIAPANRARVVASLADWFDRRDNAGTDVTIARYDRDFEVVLPRTSDAASVAPRLRSLAAAGMRAVEEQLDERRTLDTIRQIQRRGIEDSENTPGARTLPDAVTPEPGSVEPVGLPCSKEMLRQADDWADRVERSGIESLTALQAYAASLAALPGRKVLLFVSDGIPSRPGGPAYDLIRTLCDGSGASQGIQDAIDVSVQQSYLVRTGQLDRAALALAGENRALGSRFAEIAAQANAAGVTVWTYSSRGLSASGDDASAGTRDRIPGDHARQKQELEALMSSLAIDTGGRALLEVGDLDGALQQLDADLDAAYLLAFAVPRVADGKLHKIKLETTRKGVRLRYRQSWRDTSGEEDLIGLVQGALLHGVDRPGLGASAGVGRASDGPKAGRQIVRIVVPESAMSLLPNEDGTRHGVLRIALAVQTPGGKPSTIRSRAFPIDLPALAPGVSTQPIVHDIELPDLPAGAVVAIGLRDEVDGEAGVLRLEVRGGAGEA